MRPTQIIDPLHLSEFIHSNESILRNKFPDQEKSTNYGRPRVGLRWVLIAICVFARSQNIVWRDLPSKLSYCDFLINEGYLTSIPSKSTFHRMWMQVSEANLSSWIRMVGFQDSTHEIEDLLVDSSGFEIRSGSIWRFIKWQRSFLSKNSKMFRKLHIAVALPSRAIVGIHLSDIKRFDSKALGPVLLSVYKRLIPQIKRFHADKAYWDEKIIGWCCQEGITPVIPCKTNSKINGNYDFMDFQVKYQKQYPGIYRINTRNYLRAEVEHVFGEIKLQYPIIRDQLKHNKHKSLLCQFLWYNHKNRLRRLRN
ncbi:MAG: transposase [Candidatus Heimdallarchaeota archaeon]|nr:transposase [Candidatus Heimdallarchaeota archaeon]